MEQTVKIAAAAQKRSVIFMVICSFFWSIGGLFIKMVPWNSFVISSVRSLITCFVFFGYMKAMHYKIIISRRTILAGATLCASFLCFVTANKMTTAANAIMLQYTSPIFILLISCIVFRQRPLKKDILVVAAAVVGIVLFFLDDLNPGNMFGNLIALGAGLTLGIFFVFGSKSTSIDENMSAIFMGNFITFLVGVPFYFLYPPEFSVQSVLSILVLGIFQLGVPYILYGIAIRDCPPLTASLISMFEPLLNPLWVFLVMGETPGIMALVGGIIVVVTITLYSMSNIKTANAQAKDNN